MSCRPICAVFATLAFASVGSAQIGNRAQLATAPDFLRNALNAGGLSYTGTRTVEFLTGQRWRTHTEYVTHQGARTRIEVAVARGKGPVAVEDGTQRWEYFPGRNEIEQLPARNDDSIRRLAGQVASHIRERWTIGQEDGGEVAGIATKLAVFTDRRGVVRERLYIDPQTGMILKRIVYDLAGAEKAGFRYETIDYTASIPEQAFALNFPGAKVVTVHERLSRIQRRLGFFTNRLRSSRYRLDSVKEFKAGTENGIAQFYSIGDRKFAVVQTRGPLDPGKLRQLSSPKTHVYTCQRNGETIAIVGEIDERSLEEISRDLTQVNP